ncbi:MAG: hypothetical protein AB1Z19_08130 [Eubacteriales bacterium]
MEKQNRIKRVISIFLLVQIAFWIIAAFFNLYTSKAPTLQKISATAMMFINAGIFLVLIILAKKDKPMVTVITAGVLLATIAFTIAGGISGWEYAVLVFAALSLGALVWVQIKKAYFWVQEKIGELIDRETETLVALRAV